MVAVSAGVRAVVVASAGMSLTVVVMIAHNIRVVAESARKISIDSVVSTAVYAAEKLDASLSKSSLSTSADAAADEDINAVHSEEACKSAVTAAESWDNLLAHDFVVSNVVNLELFSVAEVLKDLTVFVSNRNTHKKNKSFQKVVE